uniref:Uncharacterized protein n=1 Tax=Tolypothrix bouteillei VB521301 TaxID=1479485 RepID=A0A0C1QXQ2_9CYAN
MQLYKLEEEKVLIMLELKVCSLVSITRLFISQLRKYLSATSSFPQMPENTSDATHYPTCYV